jgi:hypothetical protein
VLRWIDRLLKAPRLGIAYGAVPAVPKDAVGRTALLNLLRSNLEMFSVYVDRCYDRDAHIATASFQVRSKALCALRSSGHTDASGSTMQIHRNFVQTPSQNAVHLLVVNLNLE